MLPILLPGGAPLARALLAEFRKLLLTKRVFSYEGEKPDVGEGGGSDSSASQASTGSSGAAVSSGATVVRTAGDAVPARVMAVALQVSRLRSSASPKLTYGEIPPRRILL